MTPITGSSRSRPAANRAELHRIAAALARAEGWETAGPPTDAPGGGLSLPVTGPALHREVRLRVRERLPGDPRASGGGAELTARRQAASEHVVDLVQDLGRRRLRGREMDAALLAAAPGGTLATLLAGRPGMSGGEAATVLLGVARGVAALHASGWAAPDLTPEGVEFTADGCPVLGLLDGVVGLRPETAVADAEAFHAFARSLCLRVSDGTGMRLLAAVEGALRTGRWPAVEEAVTAMARPVALRLDEAHTSRGELAAPRDARKAPSPHGGAAPAASAVHPARKRRDPAARVAPVLDALDGQPLRQLSARLVALVRRRPMLAAAAVLPVVFALAMVALIPDSGLTGTVSHPSSADPAASGASATAVARSSGTDAPREESGTAGDGAAREGASGGTTSVTGAPTSVAARESSPSAASATHGEAASGTEAAGEGEGSRANSDDPVDAARRLLDARHACFAAKPVIVGCLDAVLEAGAGLKEEEAAALGRPGAREERDYTEAQLSLVERWGDAALVAAVPASSRTPKSEPASLLLVRSEAGWRLRAVFP